MSESEGFIEQWERLGRWFERFEKITKGQEHTVPAEYYQDDVYAFFMNCYHLKDWIDNDKNSGLNKKAADEFVQKHRLLRLCGDICISHKHHIEPKKLSRGKNSEEPYFSKVRNFVHDLRTSPKTIKVHFTIISKRGKFDAFDLAKACIRGWENFFAINRLNVKPILRPVTDLEREARRRGTSLVKIDTN